MECPYDETRPPVYTIKPPLRFVEPYQHVFNTHAKKRWLKRKLLDVLMGEFKAYTKEYYVKAIKQGRITINGKPASVDYVVRDNDALTHKTIRIQPPVLNLPIKIISEDDRFLVVAKPPGITIHTGGGYHYNTLRALLHFEHGKKNLHLLHRLDKCTSGVILFAKDQETSKNFHEQNSKFVMKKMYYARVAGDFDDVKNNLIDMPITCLDFKNGVYTVYEHDKHKDIEAYVKTPAKQSQTEFRKMWYDQKTDSSLLQCYPKTGRTHQIRVHLQYTGHPILNDTVYGGRFIGNLILRYTYSAEECDEFMEIGKLKRKGQELTKQDLKQAEVKQDKPQKKQVMSSGQTVTKEIQQTQQKQDKTQDITDGHNLFEHEWDYKNRAMEICLHSYKYIFQGTEYVTDRPYWFEKEAIPIPTKQ